MNYNDSLKDPGFNVYLLYQTEVHHSDHSFLQSMMDWIYTTTNDSPFKYMFRNKAIININNGGIFIQRDTFNEADLNTTQTQTNWTRIHFNLKHLKEIYVDKRHKDTCVLVSKVVLSSAGVNSNYVWKKANPTNYESFRSPYALNNAYKKSYLLTIIKFKDGPSRLLHSIQILDSVLIDFNRQNNSTSKQQQLQQLKNHSEQSTPQKESVINRQSRFSRSRPSLNYQHFNSSSSKQVQLYSSS
jgi:hypothetical protein